MSRMRTKKTIRGIRSSMGSGVEFGVRKLRRISKQPQKQGKQAPEQLSEQDSERPPGQYPEQRLFEERVESRLKALGSLVTELTTAPQFGSLMRERDSIRETLVELVVKEQALREIVQMAKYSENGAVRKMLWRDIEGALGDLEKNAERFVKAACA
jgi:hypothetical protein